MSINQNNKYNLQEIQQAISKYNINKIRLDSRQVKPQDMFVAFPGLTTDGRRFIKDALVNGASCILYDSEDYKIDESIIHKYSDREFIPVANLAAHLSSIAGEFYKHPSLHQNIFAVTGTNGKTTCCYLLAQLLYYLNNNTKSGIIGTIGYGDVGRVLTGNKLEKLDKTTPDAILLQDILFEFKNNNIQNIAMEASSHALEQFRLNGINIKTALFTNLSHEHLDYHGDIDNYYLAKKKLFFYDSVENIVINYDDAYGLKLLNDLLDSDKFYQQGNNSKIILYSLNPEVLNSPKLKDINNKLQSNLKILIYNNNKISLASSEAVIGASVESNAESNLVTKSADVKFNLLGEFNKYNLLAVLGALIANNYSLDDLLAYTDKLKPAPGRLEVFKTKSRNIKLIVDFAHSPDALKKTLKVVKQDNPNHQVWCVFGCGGDRDPSKRPEMGAVAAQYADCVVITDDNPRTEAPEKITEQIQNGVKNQYNSKIIAIIHNRREAIELALDQANPGDIIVIAGKGHEDYQIYGTEYKEYNEREFVAGLADSSK